MDTSQLKTILAYLKSGNTITQLEATKKFNICRLSSIINILRNKGYGIETETVWGTNSYGNMSHHAVYRLVKDIDE